MSVTRRPSRASRSAIAAPMMPPPTTATSQVRELEDMAQRVRDHRRAEVLMGRAARRATWIVAALLAISCATWIANSLDERRNVIEKMDIGPCIEGAGG